MTTHLPTMHRAHAIMNDQWWTQEEAQHMTHAIMNAAATIAAIMNAAIMNGAGIDGETMHTAIMNSTPNTKHGGRARVGGEEGADSHTPTTPAWDGARHNPQS